jgi:ACT domain-containing protein
VSIYLIRERKILMRAIISVIGVDQRGIIAEVSTLLADKKVNILDINQTILDEYFTMTMLVDLESLEIPLEELKKELKTKGEELGVSIKLQHEDIFRSMHRI